MCRVVIHSSLAWLTTKNLSLGEAERGRPAALGQRQRGSKRSGASGEPEWEAWDGDMVKA